MASDTSVNNYNTYENTDSSDGYSLVYFKNLSLRYCSGVTQDDESTHSVNELMFG